MYSTSRMKRVAPAGKREIKISTWRKQKSVVSTFYLLVQEAEILSKYKYVVIYSNDIFIMLIHLLYLNTTGNLLMQQNYNFTIDPHDSNAFTGSYEQDGKIGTKVVHDRDYVISGLQKLIIKNMEITGSCCADLSIENASKIPISVTSVPLTRPALLGKTF